MLADVVRRPRAVMPGAAARPRSVHDSEPPQSSSSWAAMRTAPPPQAAPPITAIAHWRMQARCTPAKAPGALATASPPALTVMAWTCRCQGHSSRETLAARAEPGLARIIFRRYPWNCCCPAPAASPANRNRYGQQGVSPRSPRGTVGQPGALPRRPLRVKSPQHTVKVAQTLLQQALRPQLTTGVVPNPRTSGTPGPEGCSRVILT